MAPVPALSSGQKPPRVQGIDVARGLASILMVQGHAFDAWASAEARETWWYTLERTFLQTLALPAFLVLAGASLALRVEAALAKGEAAAVVRRAVISRAAKIVIVGYALNAFSALTDGAEGIETWLRADVLHVIGLSLIALGLAVRGGERVRVVSLDRVASVIAIVPIVACPWISRWSHEVEGPIGWALGLFVDVPPITRMPWVPLASWAAIGFLVARWMIAHSRAKPSPRGVPRRVVAGLLVGSVVLAVAGTYAQHAIVDALGGPLDRTHVAVIANAIQLVARGVLVLGIGVLIAPRLPDRVRWVLVVLGQGSLWAYVLHVPLCYGRFAEIAGLRNGLSIESSALSALGLVIVSWGAAALRHARPSVRPAPRS